MVLDERLVAGFIGKTLLIGITDLDAAGQETGRDQLFGTIVRINAAEGIVVETAGREFKLPADMDSFRVAPPGDYRVKSTGELVVNPDLLCTWIRARPSS